MSDLIEEIKENWKLEAKSENTERYFFHVKEVEKILSGKRSYVIGRKGTGKTAISEHIANIKNYQTFSEKLSFKNFPFNDIYELKNNNYTYPNQYITIWKYIIYSFICKMMARNNNVNNEVKSLLEKLYAPEPVNTLSKWVKKWTTKDFEIKILGTGGKIGLQQDNHDNSWIEKVDTLESLVVQYSGDSTYYVIFDELDEDYKNILETEQNNYTALLTGLFKAVQDIKSVFKGNDVNICPIIFLRDDIYGLIMDPDKTKWDDYKIELEWDKSKIKELLAFRISRALDQHGAILRFDDAWNKLFLQKDVMVGDRQRKGMSIFDFITHSTLFRPRDYIKYIQACAEAHDEKPGKISPSVVKSVGKQFSNYLKREMEDEIHGAIPNISQILDIISQIRKQTFSIKEFKEKYDEKFTPTDPKRLDPDIILKVLFLFSVIGNQPKQRNHVFFRYLNKEAELNFSENLVVHRGLFKALQIL
jgi:hypothetical protein